MANPRVASRLRREPPNGASHRQKDAESGPTRARRLDRWRRRRQSQPAPIAPIQGWPCAALGECLVVGDVEAVDSHDDLAWSPLLYHES